MDGTVEQVGGEAAMLESELFALMERTSDAAYAVTVSGEICSWNAGAEKLFGYTAEEVLRRNVDEVLNAHDGLGTAALAGGTDAAVRQWSADSAGIPHFDLNVQTKHAARLWINVSTIVFDNARTGRRLFVRIARDVDHRRQRELLFDRIIEAAREVVAIADDKTEHAPVDTLSDQERRILKLFAVGGTPSSIARQLVISPQTLRNHLHHINRKLRTHNRLEAVTHAQMRGLID
jgi:PAS domain S-box-containing protein